eukprot:Hpha_TRINITY_DN16729_c0_g1::TRINITY_DN16729_c0_g1_i13::g.78378::m.78378
MECVAQSLVVLVLASLYAGVVLLCGVFLTGIDTMFERVLAVGEWCMALCAVMSASLALQEDDWVVEANGVAELVLSVWCGAKAVLDIALLVVGEYQVWAAFPRGGGRYADGCPRYVGFVLYFMFYRGIVDMMIDPPPVRHPLRRLCCSSPPVSCDVQPHSPVASQPHEEALSAPRTPPGAEANSGAETIPASDDEGPAAPATKAKKTQKPKKPKEQAKKKALKKAKKAEKTGYKLPPHALNRPLIGPEPGQVIYAPYTHEAAAASAALFDRPNLGQPLLPSPRDL